MISSEQIKELREQTNISITACKKALEDANGDMEKALLILRKEGAKVAEKKSSRNLGAGIIEAYIHATKQVGVMVEVRSETDFVAKNEGFQKFAHDVAMHIAATGPLYLTEENITDTEKNQMQEIFEEEISKIDKPADIKKKILEGKMDTYIKEKTLMRQSFVKNPDITIEDYLKETIQKFGENMEIVRFVRYQV
jgi:elongation factor Ts